MSPAGLRLLSSDPSAPPALPVPPQTVRQWIKRGVVNLNTPGSGYRRTYPPGEVSALRAVDAATRLAGVVPDQVPWGPTRRALLTTIAAVARSNPPGTAHEITTPVPWIRHVLIVPEP